MDSGVDYTHGGRVTVRDVLVDAERRLERGGVPSASVDAAELVAFALGTTRTRVFLHDPIDPDQRVRIESLVTQRVNRIPLQHITGTAGFRRIELQVGQGVFIPRPETELVTEAAIRELIELPIERRIAVDLCSGSGAIAISLGIEVPNSQVWAVELDDQAVRWTQQNVDSHASKLHDVASSVTVVHADASTVAESELATLAGTCAVVISNPPYIPLGMVPLDPEVRDHEPRAALFGGEDGMDLGRGVVATAAQLLAPGGTLVIEHADVQGPGGAHGGVPGVVERARELDGRAAFVDVVDRTDFNGRPRFTVARRAGGKVT